MKVTVSAAWSLRWVFPTMKRSVSVLVLLLVPGGVCAQDTVHGWPGLNVSGLPTMYVLDDTGHETEGALLRLNPDSLVLLVDGHERPFEAGHVRRIEKRGDSLRNGAIIGTIFGVLNGLVATQLGECSGSCLGAQTFYFLFFTGMWAAVGTGIDAAIPGRTTLYDARTAQPASGTNGSAAPRSLERVAISFKFRW
jgi:hypothetical protein